MNNVSAQVEGELREMEYSEDQLHVIDQAIGILEAKIKTDGAFANSSGVRKYCQLHIANEKDEHFGCLYLDSQHRLIRFEVMFKGTVDGASVYPRPVVRRALELNAAAVILTHNHPSGLPNPSQADIAITKKLQEALMLIDVRVLDHIVVGSEGSTSMAEDGQL